MTKKTLTLLMVVCLVLLTKSEVKADLASITLKGEAKFKYSWATEASILDGYFTIYDKVDQNTQFYLTTKYLNPDSDTNNSEVFVDSCFVIYEIKPIRGTIAVGYFNYATGNLDLLDGAIGDIKSYSGVKLLIPVFKKCYLKFGIIPDERIIPMVSKVKKSVYAAGFDYFNTAFGIGANYIYIDPVENNYLNPAEKNDAYTVNAYYKPNDFFKFYLHYGSDQNRDLEQVLGFNINLHVIPMSVTGEYNFDDEPLGSNPYGYKITYHFSKHLALYYCRVNKTFQTNELVFQLIW